MFEVQVQGKFRRKPTGKLYLGAETTKKMQLGMITRVRCAHSPDYSPTASKQLNR